MDRIKSIASYNACIIVNKASNKDQPATPPKDWNTKHQPLHHYTFYFDKCLSENVGCNNFQFFISFEAFRNTTMMWLLTRQMFAQANY
jgi:hypothetical protein